MKHFLSIKTMLAGIAASFFCFPTTAAAEGWPDNYGGVMLQAFSWDSYDDSRWAVLESQADELSQSFDLIWIPQSGNCGGTSMGYDPVYWFTNYSSSFGNKRELKSMIQTFKTKGLKTIADVVINHRKSTNGWFGFPTETYNNVTYKMTAADVCADDDGGAAATQASKQGVTLSANKDTGEDWSGMRDLDHKSENVQTTVKAYLSFLINDLGYSGFRYDMVKGYSPEFTGMYNTSARPEFSVGECWDGSNTIRSWINGTKVNDEIQSAAFDFQFKYVVRNAVEKKSWTYLDRLNDNNWPLVSSRFGKGEYRRWAVTFVENHDTQLRPDGTSNGPLSRDTLAANAYLLAMPGTPCIFQPHWLAYPTELKAMIAARKQAGITNTSSYAIMESKTTHFANVIDDKLLVVVGNTENIMPAASEWVRVLSGYHYAYYFAASMNMPWVDLASSVYQGEQKATLTAVTAADGTLCYSLNNATAQEAASGTTINIPVGTTTLKVWLKSNPSNVLTRSYTVNQKEEEQPVVIPEFCTVEDGEVCAFFEAPSTWGNTVSCWAWDSKGNYTGGTWPGVACTKLGESYRGLGVWKWSWNGKMSPTTATGTMPTEIIFNNTSSPQTGNLPFENGGYYTIDGKQGNVLSVDLPTFTKGNESTVVYNLQGQRLHVDGHGPEMRISKNYRGIVVKNGKKVVLK